MARTAAGPASEERREQIVEAALRVFADKGYDAATTKDIAHAAGVTPGLIYHYFQDKRALLATIFAERSAVGITAEMLTAEGMDDLDPRVLLPLLVTRLLDGLESAENAGPFHVLMGEAMHDPQMRMLFNERVAGTVTALAGYLEHQMERGRLRRLNPTLVAQLLMGSIMSCVIRRVLTQDPALRAYTREQIAATVVDMALGGLEARPLRDEPLPGSA
jgi:AcrR family transcriptional regulator